MENIADVLRGKRVLVVDDEPDILGSLEETLDDCVLDKAERYEDARDLLEGKRYDAAILDIMGVRGYDLLALATGKGLPVLMLTAHALSADNLVRSLKGGARAYVPKDKIAEIRTFLRDVLEEPPQRGRLGRWFARLEPFFEEKFGEYWKEKSDPEFWRKYY
jgi:DNA-binding response OmpR family regulator